MLICSILDLFGNALHSRHPPAFIGDIDLGNSTILRVDILPSDRKVRYSILRRDGDKLAILDGFAIDVSHLPQLQMLTVNANASQN
jgi:hypothetical protein